LNGLIFDPDEHFCKDPTVPLFRLSRTLSKSVEGIELREIPEPAAPKSGEALVAVEFSPINFNDLMVLWGVYAWKPELPATIGNEGAGKVIAVGEGVTSVKVGDRVVLPFTVRKWQQRVLVSAEELVVVPRDADPQQAAMMAINPVTAALLLDQYVDLRPGDAVVYNAATSGLAQWLAAPAGRRDVRTIGLVRRREDIERVKQGGCEIVAVDDEEIGTVQTRLQGLNVRLALDVIGGSAGRLLHLLSPQRQASDLRHRVRQADGAAWHPLDLEAANRRRLLRRAPAHCPKNRASPTRAGQDDRARRHSAADYRDLSHRSSQRGSGARCQRREDTSEPQR
jgi:threonine dehydrogenase-like Zn-dependent dehydrogenase